MKYGETLRQRSIPAWAHHNIDYDDIKHFIKENTTPGKGKTVSVPGRGEDKLVEFENALFHILQDQHQRIDLFVKSKAGEIQRRLEHSKKQLRALASRQAPAADHRVPVSRLERYGRLENDVVKAGEEIKSLARFIATQRTAFRKLLKKYKKWTGSVELEDCFREEVLDDPKSFTKLDLGHLLDEYSTTRQSIRTLYDSQVQQSAGARRPEVQVPEARSSTIKQLQDAVESGSKVSFDTSFSTVPLGQGGTFASYFVHPENIVELQMLLLQHSRYYLSRSRQNSVATPISSQPPTPSFPGAVPDIADCHMLVADDLERFAKEQSGITVDGREHQPGSFPQRAKAAVRWTVDEDALACLRSKSGRTKSAYLKKKHIHDFFDSKAEFSSQREEADTTERVEELRSEMLKDNTKPLFHYSCSRTRLLGLDDNPDGLVLATLDSGITIEKGGELKQDRTRATFPFALLLVRQEGKPKSELLAALDKSYLVERVRGFSLEYHSIWQTYQPNNMTAPSWLPTLSQDIRKLPPLAMRKRPSRHGDLSASGTPSGGTGSSAGTLDSATAVETSNDFVSQLETPPLKSFGKKKRRKYPEAGTPTQKYWSEYDHPEDGDGDAYYIYVDPTETNPFDRFFERVADVFRRKKKPEEEGLLGDPNSPPIDDEESSDEESDAATDRNHFKPAPGFGTFARPGSIASASLRRDQTTSSLPQFSAICFAASLAMLVMAYILRTTGRHKYIREVHVGVLFSMVCSLVFVLLGFMNVLRRGSNDPARAPSLGAWAISTVVLVVDVIGSGGLLASMVG
ncbi:Putative SPX domain, VTC domain superfamily protein [Septoria linicola]|uniref:SPX domain, VTC domain superfamily protein n=1 Tax=Septoria linicola TaxID=215465 RepID=A0A9Q9B799_9PEZI|nr:Putative SPX domain, VTC domain superfamily protein [Septoria linicola]